MARDCLVAAARIEALEAEALASSQRERVMREAFDAMRQLLRDVEYCKDSDDGEDCYCPCCMMFEGEGPGNGHEAGCLMGEKIAEAQRIEAALSTPPLAGGKATDAERDPDEWCGPGCTCSLHKPAPEAGKGEGT